jgi:hypothetical protein
MTDNRICAKPCQPVNNPPETWCDELQSEVLRLRAEVERAKNNMERVVNILTPLFVTAQDHEDPDEEALGGALDVLTGWFGQNGQPFRKLDELQAEVERLEAHLVRVRPDVDAYLRHEQELRDEVAFWKQRTQVEEETVGNLIEANASAAQQLDNAEAEIERMRAALREALEKATACASPDRIRELEPLWSVLDQR